MSDDGKPVSPTITIIIVSFVFIPGFIAGCIMMRQGYKKKKPLPKGPLTKEEKEKRGNDIEFGSDYEDSDDDNEPPALEVKPMLKMSQSKSNKKGKLGKLKKLKSMKTKTKTKTKPVSDNKIVPISKKKVGRVPSKKKKSQIKKKVRNDKIDSATEAEKEEKVKETVIETAGVDKVPEQAKIDAVSEGGKVVEQVSDY